MMMMLVMMVMMIFVVPIVDYLVEVWQRGGEVCLRSQGSVLCEVEGRAADRGGGGVKLAIWNHRPKNRQIHFYTHVCGLEEDKRLVVYDYETGSRRRSS